MKNLLILGLALSFTACGLQVLDPGKNTTTGSNPNVAADTFTVSGTATGLPYKKGVVLSINGHNLTVDANGTFSFSQKFTNGASYNVDISQGLTNPGAYQCTLQNDTGSIPNANVTNVILNCGCVVPEVIGDEPGTVADPIKIYTAAQLNGISTLTSNPVPSSNLLGLSKHYKQVCDLDYTAITPVPFGNYGVDTAFTGSYDGNDFFIRNYTSDGTVPTTNNRKGLFGYTKGALLKNINLSDVNIVMGANTATPLNFAHLGSLVAEAVDTNIENIYGENIVIDDNGIPCIEGIGGLIGVQTRGPLTPGTVILTTKNVHVENVNIVANITNRVGGVVGIARVDFKEIEANAVTVSCKYGCGGVVGSMDAVQIVFSDISAQGIDIKGLQNVGGIVGEFCGTIVRAASVGIIGGLAPYTQSIGGVIGYDKGGLTLANSFTSTDITSLASGVLPNIGVVYGDQNSVAINDVAYDAASLCPSCTANVGPVAQSAASFQSGPVGIMSTWNFSPAATAVWCEKEGTFPRLAKVPYSICQ